MSEWHTGWTEGYASARAEMKAELAAEREAHKETWSDVERLSDSLKMREEELAAELERVNELRDALERLNGWGFAIQQLTADLKHVNDVLKGDEDD